MDSEETALSFSVHQPWEAVVSHAKLTYIKIIAVLEVAAGVWGISINIYVFLRYPKKPDAVQQSSLLALIVNLMLLCGYVALGDEDQISWSRILQAMADILRTPLVTYQFIRHVLYDHRTRRTVQFWFTHNATWLLGPADFIGYQPNSHSSCYGVCGNVSQRMSTFCEEDKSVFNNSITTLRVILKDCLFMENSCNL